MNEIQRVRRGDAEWAAIIAQFNASGLSAKRFCQQQGISYGTFIRRRLRAARNTEPAESLSAAEWLPIDVTGDRDGSTVSDAKIDTGGWDVELSLPGGLELRLRGRG